MPNVKQDSKASKVAEKLGKASNSDTLSCNELADPLASPATLRPAEAAFEEAQKRGASDFGALLHAIYVSPGDTLKMFGEVFVEDELRSFVGGMDFANHIAGLSPDKNTQLIASLVTKPLANLVDIIAGAIRGDSKRIHEALKDVLIEGATDATVGAVADATGIKTFDGRVSPILVNGSGGISNAGAEVVLNNAILDKASSWFVEEIKRAFK